MVFYEKEMVVKRKATVEEERELEPKLDILIVKTKELQRQVGKDKIKQKGPGPEVIKKLHIPAS